MNFSVSKRGEYGLVAAVYLAQNSTPHRCQIHEIATNCSLPEPFLAQILRQLVRGGIVDSKKGVGGGFRLAREASEIAFLEVLESLDGPIAVNTCQGPTTCDHQGSCSLQPVWSKAQKALLGVLKSSTLSDAMATDVYPLTGVVTSEEPDSKS